MGCLDEEGVLALVEGTLGADDRARIEQHLARCADCRTLVARTAEALLSTGAVSGDCDVPARTPRSGEVVGRYRVTGMLGSGAMGIVVSARDEELGREVALKLLRRDASRDVRERFVREARAAGAIAHPGVVAVHDVLTTADGHPVIVMDRLHGETLRQRLEREGALDTEAALAVARSIAAALGAAHAHGIVHRDLKPENVFLARQSDGTSELKLLDFGVAKLAEPSLGENAALTATGTIVGTPYYMAPEQAFGSRDVDARADLWSLGVILYECLSGRRPFAADSVGQALRLLALGRLTPLAEVAPEVPPRVVGLVERLLSERDLRPASAAEVERAIEELDWRRAPPTTRARWWLGAALVLLAVAFGTWKWSASSPPTVLTETESSSPLVLPRGPTLPVVTVARAEPSRQEPAPRTARRPEPKAPPVAPDAGVAKTGPGKLLTEPLF